MSVWIITDSASDMTGCLPEGIRVLPLTVTFGEESFLDGVELSHRAFYEKLVECEEMPKTSLIPPADFESAYAAIKAAGDTAVVITLSSKLSGTYQSAVLAAEEYEDIIYPVDSEEVSVGERVLVEYALRLRQRGMDAPAIAAELNRKKKEICVVALLDTLEYLKKGGRISAAAAIAGGILSIKPVITIEEGEVAILGKARGSRQGNNMLVEMIGKKGGIDFEQPICLGYTGLTDALLQKYIADSEALWRGHGEALLKTSIGGTIGTHGGPGAVAVAFFHA